MFTGLVFALHIWRTVSKLTPRPLGLIETKLSENTMGKKRIIWFWKTFLSFLEDPLAYLLRTSKGKEILLVFGVGQNGNVVIR